MVTKTNYNREEVDICFTIRHYDGGIEQLIEIFKNVKSNKLVKEGLGKIRAKFDNIDAIGPTWVAKFQEIQDEEEIERVKRDSYERINTFLIGIEVEKYH